MDIQLQHESVVSERTGEISAPSEYLANLRQVEAEIQLLDEQIDGYKTALKAARESREQAVAKLRAAVREGKVLPLLEREDETETDDDDRDE